MSKINLNGGSQVNFTPKIITLLVLVGLVTFQGIMAGINGLHLQGAVSMILGIGAIVGVAADWFINNK